MLTMKLSTFLNPSWMISKKIRVQSRNHHPIMLSRPRYNMHILMRTSFMRQHIQNKGLYKVLTLGKKGSCNAHMAPYTHITSTPPNSHQNIYEKEFQMTHVQDETYPTSIGQDKDDFTNMYRKVNDIVMNTNPNVCLAHMRVKKGIAKHGDRAIQAVLSKFAQINGKKVVKPLNPATLPLEEKNKGLRAITLIKEKRCDKLKGRACADGRKQRPYI